MALPPSLQHFLLAVTVVLGFCNTAHAVCKSDGGYACPAEDEITPVRGAYDPAEVDWNAVVADIYALTDAEPRLCAMAIRSWFHDIAAFEPSGTGSAVAREDVFPGIQGSDASIFTHTEELEEPKNAGHGFSYIAKHVMVQLAAAHGASHADILTVFSAMCPNRMKATVDIPSHCEAEGFPLYVGKQDYEAPTDLPKAFQEIEPGVTRVREIRQSHTRIPTMYYFMMTKFNKEIPEAKWKLNQQDATALIGAHGVMQNQNCMTDGVQPDSAPDLPDRTCAGGGGTQRMFKWSNHYWQDVSSGSCQQTNNGGRSLTSAESASFTQCSWNSLEGFALGERLECDAMKMAQQKLQRPGSQPSDFPLNWDSTKWTPDNEINLPAACCGYTCQDCEENPESKFWCGVGVNGKDRFWPYAYMDCDWHRSYEHGSRYCDGDAGEVQAGFCTKNWGSPQTEIRSIMGNVKGLLDKYRGNADAWQEDYAVAFCKLSNFGTNYTTSKTSFASLFQGVSTGCLDVKAVLSPKQCPTCEIAGRDPGVMQDAAPIGGTPTQTVAPEELEPLVESTTEEPDALPAKTLVEEDDTSPGGLAAWMAYVAG